MNQNEQLQQLLQTPQGKRLGELLRQRGGEALRQAAAAAKAGDTAQVQALMGPLVEQPEIRQLLQSMGQQLNG